jgi:uncharacterized Ntn-hydrolase superfamily protein
MSPKSIVATFSIVAADPAAGDVGIAVASKFLAVGAVVPWAEAVAGAVATQSYANVGFGPKGLAMMRGGMPAEVVLERLLADDPDARMRQVGLVDARGGSAAHTGDGCHAWAGHITGPSFACQGNILTGEETVAAMAASFRNSKGALADRLYAALAAGDAAGGDRRGRQSAALYVAREKGGYLGFNDVLIDLRVDDSTDPIPELGRLLKLQHLFFGSSPREEKLPIEGALLRELQTMMIGAGHFAGAATGIWDAATAKAFVAFVGTENLEERIDLQSRTIDPPALEYLRQTFPRR